MSEIKAIEKLRESSHLDDNKWTLENGEVVTMFGADPTDQNAVNWGEQWRKIADEIEREIAERYQLLPVDADGVPIHLGDRLECYANGYGGTFTVFAIGNDTVVGDHDIEWIRDNPSKWFHVALSCHNVKPRTIEDVLEDFLSDYDDWDDGNTLRYDREKMRAELFEKYADEIREMLGGDAE